MRDRPDPTYREPVKSANFQFAFTRIGSLIREGVFKQFPETCPECGGNTIVSHGGDRIECFRNKGVDKCGWGETRCADCGVTPNGYFTYSINGDLLNPTCVQQRGFSL